ncbi:glycoside hydrolase family 6 protein [Streptomyces litchfieldiae]|uniref:Glucanase n=1 Tax=Streptomyces litchfieldiae TaxID=3075543 RepID=A0ABU2MXJ1_9ACTN|nr:glycoside hydrolase family 6 protein [Streptomyces sp. DSM 44938]MDT0346387.1 glycoside hydrolase family 6 protein [Streptomyces sp. DSM 44938]
MTQHSGSRLPLRGRLASAALIALAAAVALPTGAPAAEPATGATRLDNPYAGAKVYVNPVWSANAVGEPGGAAVADQPTAVWLEHIAEIQDAGGGMGLRDHLDEALAHGADLVQLVLRDLPGRDCEKLVSDSELGPDEIGRYQTEFIDPIVEILADPDYADLRVVAVVEPGAVATLVTHTSPRPSATPQCDQMKANGNYLRGIGYALDRLATLPNAYSYLDIGHHASLGWDDNLGPAADLLAQAATTSGASPADVHGIIANVANYSVLHEGFFDVDDVISGQPVRISRWVDWNRYIDEVPYALAFRDELIDRGFAPDIGVLVDTSRNGWGGPDRPTGPGTSTDVNTYVNQSRLDRRTTAASWCNVAKAGLGERPAAAPAPGIDAYVWAKPPGESDGSPDNGDGGGGMGGDRMCAEYAWFPGQPPTDALPGGPPAGEWFPEHFARLLANAWPPLES